MATYREIVYMCLDELKLVSDDSHFTQEHIIFLADKIRGALLAKTYKDTKKEIPESNYQTVCIDLERVNAIDGVVCGNADYMKSTEKIPNMLPIGKKKLTSVDFFQGNFAFTNNERFKYVGENKYLKNQIYSTISPDHYLYMRSNNPQLYYLEKVKLTGIFEDASKAAELQCDSDSACDVLDAKFPLEEPLVSTLINLIVQELGGLKYQAEDKQNNANDDLSTLAAYIRSQIALGKRSDLYDNHS